LTRFLTYITIIFLIIGIPSALAELVQPSRGQWIHWVLIASAVLAALWILRLIIWVKERRKEADFYRAMGRGMDVSPPLGVTPTAEDRGAPNGKRWYVKPDGTTTDTPPYNASEPISSIVSEPLMSQSVFQQEQDLLSKLQKYKRNEAETDRIKEETELIKEIKEDIRDERQRSKWG